MVLSASEESLIQLVRTLNPEEARKILNWAQQLADLGNGHPVEWSDSGSDEDLTEATAAAMTRFERHESEER